MLDGSPNTFWQSDYLDRAQRLPQWVRLELPREARVSALLCGAWTGSTRGTILRASLSASLDGERFEEVCRGEWAEDAAGDGKLFAFPPRPVRFLRLDVDWAVMYTGDSNAASISSLSLFDCPLIASAEPLPVCQVRFGTPLERALAAAALPDRLPVLLADGSGAKRTWRGPGAATVPTSPVTTRCGGRCSSPAPWRNIPGTARKRGPTRFRSQAGARDSSGGYAPGRPRRMAAARGKQGRLIEICGPLHSYGEALRSVLDGGLHHFAPSREIF